MATDLSHLVPGLVPESEAATNTVSTPDAAMTAPGTVSESTRDEPPGDPLASERDADRYDGRQLEHGAEARGGEPGWDDVSGRRLPWSP